MNLDTLPNTDTAKGLQKNNGDKNALRKPRIPLENTKNGLRDNHMARRVILTVSLWFAVVLYLSLIGFYHETIGQPPVNIIISLIIPISLFALFYGTSQNFKAFVLNLDASLVVGFHALRTVGFSFLVLANIGSLPWFFALPAGLGDIAVALSAPVMSYSLWKNSAFITSHRFYIWNMFGLVDFIIALSSGALSTVLGISVVGAPMTYMSVLPLVMIPVFAVPLFTITHIIMLIKIKNAQESMMIA